MDGTTGDPIRETLTVSVRADVAAAARAQGLDVDAACEAALRRATSEARRAAWLARNAEALRQEDEEIEKHGLPLEDDLLFR